MENTSNSNKSGEKAASIHPLDISPQEGLSPEQVEASRLEHGSNRLVEIKGKTWWTLLLESLNDKTLKILMGAAFMVLLVDFFKGGDFIDGIAILATVAAAALVTAYNDWRAQSEFKSLQIEREAFDVRIIRGGKAQVVSAFDLVVGDLVEVEAGDKIPADGQLLIGVDLCVDESMLTGESEPVAKHQQDNCQLLSGTMITDGRATMVVTAVGEMTEYGVLRSHLATNQERTPLQERLGKLADRIGIFGLSAAILIFLALFLSALVRGTFGGDLGVLRELLTYMALAVTIIVVAVPEGLPVAVTLSLAYSVMKMAKDKSLVRRLMACETMGAANVVCVDKTGTLTLNRMEVERLHFIGGQEGESPPKADDVPLWSRELFQEIASVNSTAHLQQEDSQYSYIGNPTEGALLKVVQDWKKDYLSLRRQADVLGVLGFTSTRKRMSTVVKRKDTARVLTKGAPEVVLNLCSQVLDKDGPRPITDEDRQSFGQMLDRWSTKALRTLALAYKDTSPDADFKDDSVERDLVLVALAGLGDPIRSEVPEAIRQCQDAGVEVKVVTGDSHQTALAVTKRIGLLKKGDSVMDGETLRNLSDEDLTARLSGLRLVYRAIPSDKHRLVDMLKRQGKVVGVTGDGSNDGPALRHADIGLSMGLTGTDVAREASDIVILDDNFASIVKALRWGRAIFANIRKFIQFQLTVSLVALATAFIAGITGMGTPLTVVQLLWVNLIMDTLAALALSVEPPKDHLLKDPPHGRSEPLISRSMWVHILGMGSFMLALLLTVLYTDIIVPRGSATHYTMVFNIFVFLQIGNLINCRSTHFHKPVFKDIFSSKLFLAVFVIIFVSQILIVQFGGSFFRTQPIDAGLWVISILLGSSMVFLGAILRLVGRLLPQDWPERIWQRLQPVRARLRRIPPWLDRPANPAALGLWAAGGAVAILISLALRSAGAQHLSLAFPLFTVGIALIGLWTWQRRKMWAHKENETRGMVLHAVVSCALALILVIYANYLGSRHYHRFDLTATQKFSLSAQTLRILEGLDYPATITSVFRPGQMATEIQGLLDEYAAKGRHISVQHINPDRDSGEVERLADRAGLRNPRLSSVMVEYQGRYKILPWQDFVQQQYEYRGGRRHRRRDVPPLFRGEEAISTALVELSDDTPTEVCFLTGSGERDPEDFDAEGFAMARDRLRRAGYTTRKISFLGTPTIPDSCEILIQGAPNRPLGEQGRAALSAFLDRAGKWFLMVEPWQTGGLDPLLAQWGLEVRSMYLADPSQTVAGLGPTTLVASHYQDHPITSVLSGLSVVFPYATSVRIHLDGTRNLEGANLILTSKKGIGETNRRSRVPKYDPGEDLQGQISVAAAVHQPVDYYAVGGVRQDTARIVLVGDADFATNSHLHRAGNADFFMSSIDWLSRRDDLIGVRARPPDVRRVTLSVGGQTALYWLSLGVLPGLVALLGGLVAWRRRN